MSHQLQARPQTLQVARHRDRERLRRDLEAAGPARLVHGHVLFVDVGHPVALRLRQARDLGELLRRVRLPARLDLAEEGRHLRRRVPPHAVGSEAGWFLQSSWLKFCLRSLTCS